MTPPALSLTPAPSSSADVLVIAARSGADGVTVLADARDGLDGELAAVGFGGGKDELVRLPGTAGGPALAVVGLPETVDEDALRYAAGTAIRQLAGVEHVALDLPAEDDSRLGAVLEGAALGAYAFTEYRSASRAGVKAPVGTIEVVGASESGDDLVARALAVSGAAALVKDLVNTPRSTSTPRRSPRGSRRPWRACPSPSRCGTSAGWSPRASAASSASARARCGRRGW